MNGTEDYQKEMTFFRSLLEQYWHFKTYLVLQFSQWGNLRQISEISENIPTGLHGLLQ